MLLIVCVFALVRAFIPCEKLTLSTKEVLVDLIALEG